ncbi:MAG TPA: TetR/AcrR family transcriptional regulator [Vicinamibacterales bacterium]|jgi:AcrR family transcriptional regulator|nr:TetR/AcrR family transcriptional regulator [Vicinamibacterales bacterium]
MTRAARVSPDQILAAAADEFAERGFAGARVDRIARRAHVNKAMLYYHFKSKQHLYRTLLRRSFTLAGGRLQAIAAGNRPPADKVQDAIVALGSLIREHAQLPSMMLREVADGGAHLDRETLAALASVPRAFAEIVTEGVAAGAFRDLDPLAAYFTIIAPVLFFHASAPIRRQLTAMHLMPHFAASDDFVRHVQDSVRLAFAPDRSRKRTTR